MSKYMGQIMAECDCQHQACEMRGYCMATRIEELEAKLSALSERHEKALMFGAGSRSKLAKAVDTLEKMNVGEGWAAQTARATLAELKGQDDE